MMLAKILKALLILLLLAALGAFAYWLCLVKGWPWWVAGILVAGIVGIWIGILFVRNHLLRSRERKFVQRVIQHDTAAIKTAPVSERHQLLELQEHWKESIQRIQNSNLRKKGNPLYVLPWYLITGESGVGKTSAVKNARLSSSMTEVSRSAGISSTRNCDWWFFDQAIILDTAGRYAIPVDEGQDLDEWKRFLVLLSKYRKKEPLNGAVVAIAADKLLQADENQLREDGQSIRQRIDQMMRTMGAKFPVYVLITKMDLVHGFAEFSRRLPQESLAQAMGCTNTEIKPYWKDVMEEGMELIAEHLKDLRLVLVHKMKDPAPGVILFPNEFERLKPGLGHFLKALFEVNTYQETPLLRGLYFSSALREGKPNSDFLQTTGVEPIEEPEADQKEGFFLKDFFSGILPKDRNLFSPILEYLLWRRLTRSLGLLSWMLLGLCVCGLLTFSFYKNFSIIKGFTEDFYDPPRLSQDRATDLVMLDKMRLEILDMEEENRSWLLPRFGLKHSIQVQERLKKHFSLLFRDGFLFPLDDKMSYSIDRVTKHTPEDEFLDYVGYFVARITVLKEHLAGKRLTLSDEFKTITSDLLMTRKTRLQPEIAAKFGDIYYAYLTWNRDEADLKEKLETFRLALIHLHDKKGGDLRWLVRKWVPGVPDLHLTEFWGTAVIAGNGGKVVLPGSFTSEGRKHVEGFIKLIEAALGEEETKALFEKSKKEFWIWYKQEFYRAWHKFIHDFHREGVVRINSVAGRQRMASLMTTRQNPYSLLLVRAADEIALLHPGKETPSWANMIIKLRDVSKLAEAEEAKKKGKFWTGKLALEKEELKEKTFKVIHPEKTKELEEELRQAKAMTAYNEALGNLDSAVSSRKQCFESYSGCFTYLGGPSKEQSPFTSAYQSYYKIKNSFSPKKSFPFIWDLIFGPLDFIMAYAKHETSCFLQEQWEEQVLSVLQGADTDKIAQILFDKSQGVVWKFLESTSKPFIGRNESGYFARRAFRKSKIAFKGEFIHFLNHGSEGVINYQPSYRVTMETLPLEVNDDAKVEPFSNILHVNCSDRRIELENYNYPKSATFAWSPDKCGDVTLTISLPHDKLQKSYKGNMGFANFLKEFRDGTRIFPSKEFPEQEEDLKSIGISWIKVSYKIKGSEPVIRLLDRVPTKVPSTIVSCWLRGN